MKNNENAFIVTMPPPTPNGGLHVGHMSGPFLSADAFAKASILSGHSIFTTCYSDANQSYVRVTAKRQNKKPKELSDFWTNDIQNVLMKYRVNVDDYFPVDAGVDFVRKIFNDLYVQGILVKKPFPFFAIKSTGELMDEAGISGFCPKCLSACKCGICESCSSLNSPLSILNPTATLGGATDLEVVWVDVMVLETERFRSQLREIYRENQRYRPRVLWVVEDALSRCLPDFPITVPGNWGISIDHQDFNGQVINAWPEIMAQQVYSYHRALERGQGLGDAPKVVNFFGFDNSYFIAVIHAILLANVEEGKWISHAAVTNEFYNLEHAKFSTSNNHVIWAGDLVERFSIDEARFYGAFNAPGFEKANFNEHDMGQVLELRLHKSWKCAADLINQRLAQGEEVSGDVTAIARDIGLASINRIFGSYSLPRFHLRQASEDILHLLELIASKSVSGKTSFPLADLAFLLRCLALTAFPLMPVGAERLHKILTGGSISTLMDESNCRIDYLPARLFGLNNSAAVAMNSELSDVVIS